MARDMFDDVVHPSFSLGDRRNRTLPLSILLHAGVIIALIVAPLMAGNVLPTPKTLVASFIATPSPPEPPPPARSRIEQAQPLVSDRTAAPVESPEGVNAEPLFVNSSERETTATDLGGIVGEPLPNVIDMPPIVEARPVQ